MKFYISFGQDSITVINNQTFDKDCIAELEAESRSQAIKKTNEIFESEYCIVYDEPRDMKFYPRGVIKL